MPMNRCLAFTLLTLAVGRATCGLGAELGVRPKRRPSESDHNRVTIDLSALRPSLPGLVLYEYGDLAPKLVQVDLSSLNPLIQPHVIWPQFSQMELGDDRPYELDDGDAIPYLTEEDMSPRRMAKMTEEWMRGAGDMYDFVQDGDQNRLLSLHGSLPLADEVIVPLDWEQGESRKKKQKKNVFLTKGWRAGGERGGSGASPQKQQFAFPKMGKGMTSNFNSYYSRNSVSKPSPGWSIPRRRETESEDVRKASSRGHPGKKDARTASGNSQDIHADVQPVRISSQESWSVPRQYWNVPHLFVNNWQ